MTKIDPIIAVRDVELSSEWYESIFECKNAHGGDNFAILKTIKGDVLLCLHKWNEDDHPNMKNPNITPGNGLILYFRTENLNLFRDNVEKLGYEIEEDIHLNTNSNKMEFSLRDPDGYYLTISEFHEYEG